MRRTEIPTLAVVGDDPGPRDGFGGPSAWSCATALDRWAKGAIVDAAGGEARHYAAAVHAAQYHGRYALIETTTLYAPAWMARLSCAAKVCVMPAGGASHPVCAEALH